MLGISIFIKHILCIYIFYIL